MDHEAQQQQTAHEKTIPEVPEALDASRGTAGALRHVLGEVAACHADPAEWRAHVQFVLTAIVGEVEDLRAALADMIEDPAPPRVARYVGD